MNAKHELDHTTDLDLIWDDLRSARGLAVRLLSLYPVPEWNDENVKQMEAARKPFEELEFRIKYAEKAIDAMLNPPPPPVCCDKCNQPIPPEILEHLR